MYVCERETPRPFVTIVVVVSGVALVVLWDAGIKVLPAFYMSVWERCGEQVVEGISYVGVA